MSRVRVRSIVSTLLLRVERWARPGLHLLPPRVLTLLKGLSQAAAVGRPELTVEGWDQPVVPGSPTFEGLRTWSPPAVGEPLLEGGTSVSPEHAGLRCLIATECIDVGGMDEVVATLARSMHALGMAVAVAHVPRDPQQPIGRLGHALLDLLPVVTLTSDCASTWLQDWRPDVVSVHGAPTWFVELAAELGAPVVETLHGPFDLFPADGDRMRARTSSLTAVVAVSALVQAQFLQLCPDYPQQQVLTIPNGIRADLGALPSRSVARSLIGLDEEMLFVSTARHCLQKNTYGLIAAFLDVAAQEERAHLLIAGRPDDPSYVAHLAALLAGSPARDRVHLRDHLPSPLPLLAAADAFVLDSFFEGWSLASMEAVAAGVPVVLSDVGGAREQLALPLGADAYAESAAGFLVPNPSGSPVHLDWTLMNRLKYAHQSNRELLVGAMLQLADAHDEWLESKPSRVVNARERFSLRTAMRRHADVLLLAASGSRVVPGVKREGARSVE